MHLIVVSFTADSQMLFTTILLYMPLLINKFIAMHIKQKDVDKSTSPFFVFSCWATRIRTWNDRTRICSVTITP